MSAGAITDCSQASPGDVTVEVCVIGSGSGGATAAWELAKAGRDVLVLEEGGDYTGRALTQRDGAMYDQLYMDRGGRATSDLSIAVLQGRVLGGGGVINASDVVPIDDDVARHWQKKFGLSGFGPESLEPFRKAALEDLSANRPADELLNRNNQLLRDGAGKLGWKGEVMLHNRVGCVGSGTCLIGCAFDAKRNPRFVAIPRALEAGARVFTRARAVRLDDAGKELKRVAVRCLDAKGYHEGAAFTVRARHVVLAANAVSSAELLLKSGLGNEHVGHHLSLQPQLPVTVRYDDEVRFFRGIPQAYAVTQFEQREHPEHGWWGFRLEAIAGTPGIVGSLLPEVGAPGLELMRGYSKLGAALLLLPDAMQGRVRVESSGRLRIDYALDEELRGRFREAVKAMARLSLAVGAKEVYVPSVPPVRVRSEAELGNVDGLTLAPTTAPLLSAHQQGTVRMAPNERDGAASPEGEVYGTRGVFVFDSSGFPSSASSHTMAPIITVSRMLARQLAARG
ncbi:MAG: GMC family oxidoreductase [Myxococcaceae bacterium]|nr:GMC family oxidoreductase [Myxococcaceae bacterium]